MIDCIPADAITAGILEAPSEGRSVELKPSMPWGDIKRQNDLQKVIKSILGLSNIKDGGKIILGVKQNADKTFTLEGMDETHLKTYDSDKIFQDVRSFGNPEPRFDVKNMEYKGYKYIVFAVNDFLYSPVICIKSGKNNGAEPLVKGTIYTRTFKPETKTVDDETEMREILDLAINKEIEQWSPRVKRILHKLNVIPNSKNKKPKKDATKKFIKELEDIKL